MSNYIRKLNPTFDEYEGESYLRSLQFINEEPQPISDAKLSELMSTATRMDDCDCLLVYPEKHCFKVYQAADGSYFVLENQDDGDYQKWREIRLVYHLSLGYINELQLSFLMRGDGELEYISRGQRLMNMINVFPTAIKQLKTRNFHSPKFSSFEEMVTEMINQLEPLKNNKEFSEALNLDPFFGLRNIGFNDFKSALIEALQQALKGEIETIEE